MGQTDEWMDARPFHRPCSTCCVGSVNKMCKTVAANKNNKHTSEGWKEGHERALRELLCKITA